MSLLWPKCHNQTKRRCFACITPKLLNLVSTENRNENQESHNNHDLFSYYGAACNVKEYDYNYYNVFVDVILRFTLTKTY